MDVGGVLPVGSLSQGKEVTLPKQPGTVRLSSLCFKFVKSNSSSAGAWATVLQWKDGEGNVYAFGAATNSLGGTDSKGMILFALMLENHEVQTGLSATDLPGQLVTCPMPWDVLIPPGSSVVVGFHGDGIGAAGDIQVPNLAYRFQPM
jgi:hypothetical protein